MNIAIFSPYATVVPHFETELDIAQQHLDAGDNVEFINCEGELGHCDFNPSADPIRCQQCLGRRTMGLELLEPNVTTTPFGNRPIPPLVPPEFGSLQELKAYRIDHFDIGYAALSSLVSHCRDPEPDLNEHRTLLNRFLQSSWHAYQATLDYLATHTPDRVYLFNGRFASMRAVFRACQKFNIDCYLHERGCDNHHYAITENHLIHDIEATNRVIRQHWANAAPDPERNQIAADWYLDRINRVERNWHSFVKNQEAGLLPDNWQPNRKNVAIYCSSEDEFVAIGECWKNDLYPDQANAIARIARSLLDIAPEIHLTLRTHPNLAAVDNARKRALLALDFPNLTIIPPEAPIDTYALMQAADTVVTFGSSVGIEAVFWDRPSILLGPCFYEKLGGVYRARTHSQTIDLICQPLSPQEKTGAFMYGYWLQTRGLPHRYYQPSGLFDGTFKGQTLYARPEKKPFIHRVKTKARRLLRVGPTAPTT